MGSGGTPGDEGGLMPKGVHAVGQGSWLGCGGGAGGESRKAQVRRDHADAGLGPLAGRQVQPRRVLSWAGSGLVLPEKEDSGSRAEQSCSHLGVRGERPVEEGNPRGLRTPLSPDTSLYIVIECVKPNVCTWISCSW